MSGAGAPTKAALRAEVRARRDALDPAERASGSAAIAAAAITLLTRLQPRVLAGYRAIRSEVDPTAILDWALAGGIVCALPAVNDATSLVFRRYRSGDRLAPGPFGTLSPPAESPETEPDVLLIPMIGFDRRGTRLGHGGGFYDRGVADLQSKGYTPVRIGLAYAVQEIPAIPHEPHDIRMDWIVTEAETLDVGEQE